MKYRFLPMILIPVWATVAVLGWASMARFATTPGIQAAAPRILPATLARLSPDAGAAGYKELFVALHPECSCSRATLRELTRVVNDDPARDFELTLLLFQPKHLPEGWKENADLVREAAGLRPRVIADVDGEFASALHASTSGEVLLYSADRRLLFQGGITAQRGHEGANRGGALLLAALEGRPQTGSPTSVFGCAILDAPAEQGKL